MNFDNLDVLLQETLVTGVKHNLINCQEFYEAVTRASEWGSSDEDISIQIKRDPDNPYDAYAVQVLGKWPNADGRKKSALLGFLPKEMAWRVGQETEPDDKLYGELYSLEPNAEHGFDLRVNVYVKYAL